MGLPLALGLASAALFVSVALISLAAYLLFRRYSRTDDLERGPPNAKVADGPDPVEPTKDVVRRFGWNEIESLTGNFTSPVIGEGGFSTVYLARFSDSSLGAIKIQRNSERLHRVFCQELDVLRHVHHHHIVRLLGYCDEKEEGVLVFEYVPNGSLHEKLHGHTVLPWAQRMSIAFRLAEAVNYLHESCDLQIVHGDIKASNVLLDDGLDPKLCDFGFARMGFSSMVHPPTRSANPMMGSPGYVDPNYLRTGMVSKKSDVYSFGVLVLELITGMEAFCSEKEQLLTALMGPALRDTGRVGEMVDPRMRGAYDVEEAAAMASVSALCLGEQPSLRPSMAEIMWIMREKVPASVSISTVDGKSNDKQEL